MAEIVDVTITVITFAIVGRALLSWFPIDPRNPAAEFLFTVTEPILKPLRSILPRMGMMDLSPFVAILLLQFLVRPLLLNALTSS